MYRIIFIAFIFISYRNFGQEHSTLFQSETILKNNVFKVLEYNPTDSIRFFEDYPSGYYSKFDKLGRIIESNHYSPFEINGIWQANMFKNYYLYDSLNNQIGIVQINDQMEQPIRLLEVKSFDKLTDSIKIARLSESFQTNSNFVFENIQKIEQIPFWGDTLKISKTHELVKSIKDSTISMHIFYNENGLKDSTIFRSTITGLNGKFNAETVTKYTYYKNENIHTIVQINYQLNNTRKIYAIYEYVYLENELLDLVMSFYSHNNVTRISKFKYFFRQK
ncbi:MAG: hypothetical protein IT222_00480 [Crocinitomix sp.]|nr:hypothetical protein [Crocinitomix sp.]